jgi:bifunctional enzyme CysN/CysC
VLDASELSSIEGKQQIDRHDVGECVLETVRPVAFDLRGDVEQTARFVIVDDFEIAGAGVILETAETERSMLSLEVQRRELTWEKGSVTYADRVARTKHDGKLIIVNGPAGSGKRDVAKAVEKALFERGCQTYYFGISNWFSDLDRTDQAVDVKRYENIQQLGQLARVVTDAGLLFITTTEDLDDVDLEQLKTLSAPQEVFVVNVGENVFSEGSVHLALDHQPDLGKAVDQIVSLLMDKKVMWDFSI